MATFFSLNSFQSQMPLFMSDFISLVDSDLEPLIEKQWLEEDIKESSDTLKDVIVYWYAFHYMICMYLYYEKNQLSGTTGWADVKEEFDFDTMLDLFACHGINLWNVIDIIGLPDFTVVNPGVKGIPGSPTLVTGTIIVDYFTESSTSKPGDLHTLTHTPLTSLTEANTMCLLNGVQINSDNYTFDVSAGTVQIDIQVYTGDTVAILYMY